MKRHVQEIFLAMAASGIFLYGGCTGGPPDAIGLKNNRLAPCPKSPNCVSSQDDATEGEDSRHAISPLVYEGPLAETRRRLIDIINAMKRTTLVTADERYIHAEFRSALFRFVDDVEFFFPEGQNIIHVRSASRVGYSDLGVNRKRIESVRSKLSKSRASCPSK